MDEPRLAPSNNVPVRAQNCGVGCISQPDDPAFLTCTNECLVTGTGLTKGCAQCFGDNVLCAKTHCLPECMNPQPVDPENPSGPTTCDVCRDEKGCSDPFYECSGLTRPTE